jgi:hypothetical protein
MWLRVLRVQGHQKSSIYLALLLLVPAVVEA